ncbi:Mitochondrial distribution and morphology protein 12 [Grifola frondosa]|uniref:Mitochondrial distribution and morphology protein 12 n=1 Tax=Grifola frondosa TaxID=5627 RepID=A0A1C7LSK5_GRIFR|nr:Mitochondrial distribution and morphology protein 12 [Grifola frondosa]
MSIDLEWARLDSSLASSLVDMLNRQLTDTARPSFIGPIEVTSFDFGSASPDVELVDLRDIYRDFLEGDHEDEDVEQGPTTKPAEWPEDEEGYEWVSRKAVRGKGLGEDGPAYHLLPPHMRYSRGPGLGPGFDMLSSTPFLRSPRDIWSPALTNLADLRSSYPAPSLYVSAVSSVPPPTPVPVKAEASRSPNSALKSDKGQSPLPTSSSPHPKPPNHPNVQLHLHITWHSNLRLTLTTSLLINYPSPMFMSLPIKLSVTGLLFSGEVAVAYEGERQRVHLCILDELDPYGPLAGDRPKRDTPSSGGTPPEADDDTPSAAPQSRTGKPLPIGQRLLPTILIESEIGQADKHVLKNVTRVERFIQDVIRKTVEDELVFPNFHTILLADPEQ